MPNYKLVFTLSDGSTLDAGTIEVPHDAIAVGAKVEALEQTFAETAEAVGEAMEHIDQRVTDLENTEALPSVTEEEHEGMVLRVVGGEWVPSEGADENTEGRLTELEEQMAELLYKEISITSFSHNAGTKERGSVVTAVTLTWAINKTPKSLTLDGEALDVGLTNKALTGLNITNNRTWTLKATDERDKVSSKSATISFQNCVYYGMAEQPTTIDSAFIQGFATKGTKTSPTSTRARSFNAAGDGTYIWYCLPTELGKCSFSSAGFPAAFTLVDTISFTNALGHTENYYVYRSDERINKTIPIGVS